MQTRLGSLGEVLTNVVIGYLLSVAVTALVMPAYGHAVTLSENLQITAIFTAVSIARGYVLRRAFNALTHARRSDR